MIHAKKSNSLFGFGLSKLGYSSIQIMNSCTFSYIKVGLIELEQFDYLFI